MKALQLMGLIACVALFNGCETTQTAGMGNQEQKRLAAIQQEQAEAAHIDEAVAPELQRHSGAHVQGGEVVLKMAAGEGDGHPLIEGQVFGQLGRILPGCRLGRHPDLVCRLAGIQRDARASDLVRPPRCELRIIGDSQADIRSEILRYSKGVKYLAIYELDGDDLRLCTGDTKTRPKVFDGKKGSGRQFEVWKRMKD